jgi:multiple sugar transport system substrate-binding protein
MVAPSTAPPESPAPRSRRRLLVTAGALGAAGRAGSAGAPLGLSAGLLGACRPGIPGDPSPAQATPAPVTLEYWHSWTAHWEEMTEFVARAFRQRRPHVTVNQVVVNPLQDKLLTAIAGGASPDVATVYSAINVPSYAQAGAALPLEKHADKHELAQAKAWYHPMIWDLGVYEGQVYGLSYWQQASCLGWNQRLFADAGLDAERPPRTIVELDELAVQLTRGGQGQPIERLGFLPGSIWHWVPVFGGQFFDDARGKVTANHPNNVKALEWMASYRKRFTVAGIEAFVSALAAPDRAQQGEPFLNNYYAMIEVGGPWKLGDWRKFGPPDIRYGNAPYPNPPGHTGTATWTYGDLSVVPQGTKHPGEAWRFVMFTGGVGGPDDYAQVLLWGGGHPINAPVSTKMLQHAAVQQALRDYPGFETMIKLVFAGARVGIPPKTPVGSFYSSRLGAAVSSALKLEETPKVLLDRVAEEVQQEHDKHQAPR